MHSEVTEQDGVAEDDNSLPSEQWQLLHDQPAAVLVLQPLSSCLAAPQAPSTIPLCAGALILCCF